MAEEWLNNKDKYYLFANQGITEEQERGMRADALKIYKDLTPEEKIEILENEIGLSFEEEQAAFEITNYIDFQREIFRVVRELCIAERTKFGKHMKISLLDLKNNKECGSIIKETDNGVNVIPLIRKCKICSKYGKMTCSRCKSVYYCGKECQRSDWLNHKPNCK